MRLIKDNVERVALTEAQIAKLKTEGYKEIVAQTKKSEVTTKKALDDMNVSELKDLAKERGLEGYSSLSKEELLSILKDVVK